MKPPASTFDVTLPVNSASGEESVKLSLAYYYCQEGASGLCKSGSVQWSIPLKFSAKATASMVKLEHEAE